MDGETPLLCDAITDNQFCLLTAKLLTCVCLTEFLGLFYFMSCCFVNCVLQTDSLSDGVTWDQYTAVVNQLEVCFTGFLSAYKIVFFKY